MRAAASLRALSSLRFSAVIPGLLRPWRAPRPWRLSLRVRGPTVRGPTVRSPDGSGGGGGHPGTRLPEMAGGVSHGIGPCSSVRAAPDWHGRLQCAFRFTFPRTCYTQPRFAPSPSRVSDEKARSRRYAPVTPRPVTTHDPESRDRGVVGGLGVISASPQTGRLTPWRH